MTISLHLKNWVSDKLLGASSTFTCECRCSGVVLRSCGLSPSEADLQKIQQQVGRKIDFDTFVKVAQNFKANNRETEEDIREAFRVFDKDGTGYVSVAELKHAMISLGERLTEEEVDELTREADIDADGR